MISDPPNKSRLLIERGGKNITKKVPLPVVLIDSKEKMPFTFALYPNWIAGEKIHNLPTGDYSVEGQEDLIILERKTVPELAVTLFSYRERFIRECHRLAEFKHKAIIIEGSYKDILDKSSYYGLSDVYPNSVSGTLDAIEARFGIQIIYTSTTKSLAERKAASWLSKAFTANWLEQNGYGRVFREEDDL